MTDNSFSTTEIIEITEKNASDTDSTDLRGFSTEDGQPFFNRRGRRGAQRRWSRLFYILGTLPPNPRDFPLWASSMIEAEDEASLGSLPPPRHSLLPHHTGSGHHTAIIFSRRQTRTLRHQERKGNPPVHIRD